MNFKKSLIYYKKNILNHLKIINTMLSKVENYRTSKICPECLGKNFRSLVNGGMFCNTCGYDSRKKLRKNKQNGKHV